MLPALILPANDVEASIHYLLTRKEINKRKIGLIGHSEGGFIAPLVYTKWPHLSYIISLAGTGVSGAEVLLKQQTDPLKNAVNGDTYNAFYSLTKQTLQMIHDHANENDSLILNMAKELFPSWKNGLPDSILTPLNAKKVTPEIYADFQVKAELKPWLKYFITIGTPGGDLDHDLAVDGAVGDGLHLSPQLVSRAELHPASCPRPWHGYAGPCIIYEVGPEAFYETPGWRPICTIRHNYALGTGLPLAPHGAAGRRPGAGAVRAAGGGGGHRLAAPGRAGDGPLLPPRLGPGGAVNRAAGPAAAQPRARPWRDPRSHGHEAPGDRGTRPRPPRGTQIIGVEKVTGVGDFRVVVSHDDIPEYVGGAARTLLKLDERGWHAQRVNE